MKIIRGLIVSLFFFINLTTSFGMRWTNSQKLPLRQENPRMPVKQQLDETENFSKKIAEKISKENAAEKKFLVQFLQLPARERVKVWQEGKDISSRGLIQPSMDAGLISRGLDAVPYLAEVVSNGDTYHRTYALKILCDMDRFVPSEDLLFPELGMLIYVRQIGIGGNLNPFMQVDGRRIGKDGFAVVKWAAEQTKDKDLRFHARLYSGLLEEDVRKLPLNEQVKQWRDAVASSKGILSIAGNPDLSNLVHNLQAVLIENAPTSIPLLIDLLNHATDEYVREEMLSIFIGIDSNRLRLRETEVGRQAIEAVKKALEQGRMKPVYITREKRQEYWRWFSAKVLDDDIDTNHHSRWSVIALALEKFYGVKATVRYYTTPEIQVIKASPEMRQFVTYLTKVDPSFPSWEYTYTGDDETLHPRFKQKIERYYEQWKQFKRQ